MNDAEIKKMFSQKLNIIIKKKGMKQQDIVDKFNAKGIDVSRGMVSNWCKGRHLPKLEYALYLFEILGCSPNDLLKM